MNMKMHYLSPKRASVLEVVADLVFEKPKTKFFYSKLRIVQQTLLLIFIFSVPWIFGAGNANAQIIEVSTKEIFSSKAEMALIRQGHVFFPPKKIRPPTPLAPRSPQALQSIDEALRSLGLPGIRTLAPRELGSKPVPATGPLEAALETLDLPSTTPSQAPVKKIAKNTLQEFTAAGVMPAMSSAYAAQPKVWDVAFDKDSSLDAAVPSLLSEVNQSTSRPSFAAPKQIYGNSYTSVSAIRKIKGQLNGLVLTTSLTYAAEPKVWDVAYDKDSPLDAAVASLLSEVNQPTSLPPFSALKQIYRNSYTSVPAIRKTRAQLNGLNLSISEKESKLYPQVSLETNTGRSTVGSSTATVSDDARATTIGVDQILYDFGSTFKEIGIAESRLSSGVDRVAAERLEVLLAMIKAQLDLQSAKKLIVFYDANQKSRQRFFDLIKQKVELGASSEIDLARSETKLLEAKSKMPAVIGELLRSESVVIEFFGIVPDFSFPFYQLPSIAVNFGGNIDTVVSRHPSVLEASKNYGIAMQEVAYLKSAALGQVTLRISHSDSTQPASGNVKTTTGYIEYSNTLFDGFAQKSRIGAALAKALEFEIEKDRVERKIRQQLMTSLTEYQSARETLELRGKLLMSAGKNARDLYTSFLLNRGSLSDVFEAEESYFTSAEGAVNAMTSLYRFYYKLLHDAGQLSEAFELNS